MIVALAIIVALTPGAVRPLTTAQVCATRWGLDVRHVDDDTRAKVFAAYKVPLAARAGYVIDHLIPRELAGADDVANLWPQTIVAAHVKDRTENALHRAVCAPSPTITLRAAQQQMRAWKDAAP